MTNNEMIQAIKQDEQLSMYGMVFETNQQSIYVQVNAQVRKSHVLFWFVRNNELLFKADLKTKNFSIRMDEDLNITLSEASEIFSAFQLYVENYLNA